MKYEMDFIGIQEKTKDADAICFRYYDEALGRYVVCVYDGGLEAYGTPLKNHLNEYYFNDLNDEEQPRIDYVICSHPHQDHVSGLAEILEAFDVGVLIMNRPWLYAKDVFDHAKDGRITEKSLEERLRKKYGPIEKLEAIAQENGIPIQSGFQGDPIGDTMTILSPSKEEFLNLVVRSEKTDFLHETQAKFSESEESTDMVPADWGEDLLCEDVKTSEENEMSIVLFGDMEEESFLLTGDAGIQALGAAIEYAENTVGSLQNVKFYQIPHHGGRHNVSPSILNELVGPIVKKGTTPNKTAFVSVSVESDHPRKVVINAYTQRGVKVYETKGKTLHYRHGDTPNRGWSTAKKLPFYAEVEA